MYIIEEMNMFPSTVNSRSLRPSKASRIPIKARPASPIAASQADNIASLFDKMSISKPTSSSLPKISTTAKQQALARTQQRRGEIITKLGLPVPSKRPSTRPAKAAVPVQPAPASAPATTMTILPLLTRASPVSLLRPTRLPLPSPRSFPAPAPKPSTPSMLSRAALSSTNASRLPLPVRLLPPPPPPLRSLLPSRHRPPPTRSCLKGSSGTGSASTTSAAPSTTRFPTTVCLAAEHDPELRARRRRHRFFFVNYRKNPFDEPSRIPHEPRPRDWNKRLVFQPFSRGTDNYCPARWHDGGMTPDYGHPFNGRACECHGIALPHRQYHISPYDWSSTPTEADEIDESRPRYVTFSDTVAADSFERWYMDVYGEPGQSSDNSTPEDDERDIQATDAQVLAPAPPPASDFQSTWQALMDEGFDDDDD